METDPSFSPPKADSKSSPFSPPEHWLIRQSGYALGPLRGEQAEEMVERALDLAGRSWDAVHVFARDRDLPGNKGFEPGANELSHAIEGIFRQQLPQAVIGTCQAGAHVLDVILVEPNQWLIGFHRANAIHQRWPGGAYPINRPSEVISRAYLKTAEAIAWSEIPFEVGDKIVEIGSSPGGASQRFLDLGLEVTGVDPAEMSPLVLANPRFTHWRSKSSGVKRKLYSNFRWLSADANVAPNYTLDAIEDIVNYPTSRFEGLLLTLKLSSYDLAQHMEQYLARVRSWGFSRVAVRQLATNRRECCVVATRESTRRTARVNSNRRDRWQPSAAKKRKFAKSKPTHSDQVPAATAGQDELVQNSSAEPSVNSE